jgi:hypothetical protein
MVWLLSLISIVAAIIAAATFWYKTNDPKTAGIFVSVVIAVSLLFTWVFSSIGENSVTSDTEYLNYHYVKVRYYEPWNEYIQATCYRSEACGTDSKGNTTYCSVPYDCSYVQYHSAYWTAVLNDGDEINISKAEYNRLLPIYTPKQFVDKHRDYHTIDGDMYQSSWKGDNAGFVLYVTKHSYENRVQASHDVFNYPTVDKTTINEYGLFGYPDMPKGNWLSSILADSSVVLTKSDAIMLDRLNGELGRKKQVRLWLIVTKNKPLAFGSYQEALWKRGNKNEVVMCVGLDNNNYVRWTHYFSWCENQTFNIEFSELISKNQPLDVNQFARDAKELIDAKFVRKQFKDFKYIGVDEPLWVYITLFIIQIVMVVSIVFLCIKAVNDNR